MCIISLSICKPELAEPQRALRRPPCYRYCYHYDYDDYYYYYYHYHYDYDIYIYTHVCMYGWMDGWMYVYINK